MSTAPRRRGEPSQRSGCTRSTGSPPSTPSPGARSKELLIREEASRCCTGSPPPRVSRRILPATLFTQDVVGKLAPLLAADPDILVYEAV
jgi:hypothetical protein